MQTIHSTYANLFKAFSDEKRLKILELLRSGEKCACSLIERLDMPQSSLSYHMKILCESGVVEPRQEGKWIHYRISERGSREALSVLNRLTTPGVECDEDDYSHSKK